ncbi:hypothetical protein A3F37_04320 [Candidatus Saccharibacteria bacterium RIFCSPHIGHO2_12_FULL_41_12]|nr:MAG: hypothetical protein A3F37_04320 [Candidatus Saccharibacteria bacterium RIFCSPHIGHO2_12_FULL_41_12]
MRKDKIIELQLSEVELKVLKDILENEVVSFDISAEKSKKQPKEIKSYVNKIKKITSIVEERLSYAGGV